MPGPAIRHEGDGSVALFLANVEGARLKDGGKSNTVLLDIEGSVARVAIRVCGAADGESGTINQIRPIRYETCVIHAPQRDKWYVIAPHSLVRAASDMPRGQHGEIAYENMNLTLGRDGLEIPSQEVGLSGLSDAVHAAISEGSEYPVLGNAMKDLREELVVIKDKTNEFVTRTLGGR